MDGVKELMEFHAEKALTWANFDTCRVFLKERAIVGC